MMGIQAANPDCSMYLKNASIYYGHHISGYRKKELHQIAQEKGIREYEMYIDYSSEQYEMRYRNFD